MRWRPDTLLPTVFESSFIRQEEKLMYFSAILHDAGDGPPPSARV